MATPSTWLAGVGSVGDEPSSATVVVTDPAAVTANPFDPLMEL